MRKEPLVTGSIYHVFNRGVDKRDIVLDQKDAEWFLLSLQLFAGEKAIGSIRDFLAPGVRPLELTKEAVRKEIGEPIVSIIAYCLNTNHFHLLLRQEKDGGISEFMKRLQGGYTTAFNIKHGRSDVLFQGRFKSSFAEKENYFELLCAYVMWNDLMHAIPPKKQPLVRSSIKDYQKANFSVVSKNEAQRILRMFGGIRKLTQHGKEIISALRKSRNKGDLDKERAKIFIE